MLAIGLPSLSPQGAASLAAAQTGEAVAVEMPRRVLHPVAMSNGRPDEYVICLGYTDPAIRAAQRSVQDRQAIQGPAGRARGPNRTADDPLPLIYTGRKPLPGVPVDCALALMGRACPAAVRPRRRRRQDRGGQPGSQPVAAEDLPQEWTGRR